MSKKENQLSMRFQIMGVVLTSNMEFGDGDAATEACEKLYNWVTDEEKLMEIFDESSTVHPFPTSVN